jgi:hypothetical protein
VRKGETGRLKRLAWDNTLEVSQKVNGKNSTATTAVILCGPCGTPLLSSNLNSGPEVTNFPTTASGTRVSLTLPLVLAATSPKALEAPARDFLYIVRRGSNLEWIPGELEELKQRTRHEEFHLHVQIYVRQDHEKLLREIRSLSLKEKTSENIGLIHYPNLVQ